MRYPPEFINQVLKYVTEHGINAARNEFGVAASVINRWRRKNGMPVRNAYPKEQRQAAVKYARKHGARAASYKFNISERVIHLWVGRRDGGVREQKTYTIHDKLKYLNLAAGIYNQMPLDRRSANVAFKEIESTYGIAVSTLRRWNQKLNILDSGHTPHLHERARDAKKVQRVLTGTYPSIAAAARAAKITPYRLRQMMDMNMVRVSIRQPAPTISPAKSAAIGNLVAIMMRGARTR